MKKKEVTIIVRNNTTDIQPIEFGVVPDQFSSINATTKFSWNITSLSYSNLDNVTVTYLYNGVTTTVSAQITEDSISGIITALNSLNVGRFWSTVVLGNTYVETYNDLVTYQDISINYDANIVAGVTVNAGNTVFFSLTMGSPNGVTVDWGDGTVDVFNTASPSPSHMYTVAGSYDIKFTFADESALIDFITSSAYIQTLEFLTSGFTGLDYLELSGTSISSFNTSPLLNSTSLSNFIITNSAITSIDPSNLAAGCSIDLQSNDINSINTASFNAPTTLNVAINNLTSFNVGTLAMAPNSQLIIGTNNITTLINPSAISTNILILFAQSNKIPASQVNAVLIALDAGGVSNGTIQISGQTPAAPPSGAGITAKNNLISKGWTVLTD